MRSIRINSALAIEVICFLFIVLFMYAAISKLADYEKFNIQIQQSPILAPFARLIAWIIPIAEILIAILLMMPRFRIIAFQAAFAMMIIFTGYIIAILNFAAHVPCSCGGILESMGWKDHLIFNIVFVILAFTGAILHNKHAKDAVQA